MRQVTRADVPIYTTPEGKRRTLRVGAIVDLIEESENETTVLYEDRSRFRLAVPFEQLYDLWVGEQTMIDWDGR